jgi:hypothetical protein
MTTRRIFYCRFSLQLIQVPSNTLVPLHSLSTHVSNQINSFSLSLSMLNIQIKQHSFHSFLFQSTQSKYACVVLRRCEMCCVVLCCVVTFPSSVLSRIRDIPKSYVCVCVQHNTQQSERESVEVKRKREETTQKTNERDSI